MSAVRFALLGVAVFACAWFALGVRSVHDQNTVNALLSAHTKLTAAEAHGAQGALNHARTLNPDEELNILRAQVLFHQGDTRDALTLARGVVRREPQNAAAWLVVEVLSFQLDPALNRQAQARLRELVPPRPAR